MRVRTLLIILAMSLPCLAVAASQVYRWKDTQGIVHFSDAPPAQGTEYKIVNLNTGVVRDPPKPDKPAEAAPAQADASAAPISPGPETVKDTPENRAKLCLQLQENIEVLQNSQVAVAGSAGAPITADQRAEQLAQAQAQHKQYCTK